MYGMPQPNTYGQYGFNAYGGFPNQAAGGAAAGGAAPGMPQATAGAPTAGVVGGGAVDPAAAAAAAAAGGGQGQWAGADPSYYSNYWGGKSFCSLQYKVANDPDSHFAAGYYGQPGQQGAVDGQAGAA